MKLTKQILSCFLIAVFVVTALPVVGVSALTDGDFTYEIAGDSAVITKYSGRESVVQIPAVIDSYPVTEIGANAFALNEYVEEVHLSENIKVIGENAFDNCTWLEKVYFNEGLQYIDEGAFNNTDIVTLTLPNSLLSIGSNAFSNCDCIEEINFGNSLERINSYAFHNCYMLEEVVFPKSLKSIGDYAFCCTEYDGEDEYIFSNLFTVTLGVNIETLGEYALGDFMGTILYEGDDYSWSEVKKNEYQFDPEFITMIYYVDRTERTKEYYYAVTTNNTIVILEYLGAEKNLTVPSSIEGMPVAQIELAAFSFNEMLESVTLPSTVCYVGDMAFAFCMNLKEIDLCETEVIGQGAFMACESLESIEITETVELICDYAFSMTGLKSVTLPETLYGMGAGVFSYCENLTKVDLGTTVRSIEPETFYGCYALEKLFIPKNIVYIGYDALVESGIVDIYYEGSSADWKKIEKDEGCGTGKADKHYNCTTPKATAGLTATVTSYNSVKLTWDVQSGVTGYQVYRSENGGEFKKLADIKGSSKNSFTDKSLTSGKQYSYKVRARKYNGLKYLYGDFSEVASATPTPLAVTGFEAKVASYNSVKLAWNKQSGVTGYQILRSTDGETWDKINIKGSSTVTYTDKNLKSGESYQYKIVARKYADGKYVYGEESEVKTLTPKPTKVSLTYVTNVSSKSAKLTWKKQSGVTGYQIYRSTDNKTFKKVADVKGASTVTYTNKSLSKGKTYYYKVRARKYNGEEYVYGSFSSTKSVKISK